MNKIVKNTLILTVITLVAGLGLGLVYEVTKAPIAQAQETGSIPLTGLRRTNKDCSP